MNKKVLTIALLATLTLGAWSAWAVQGSSGPRASDAFLAKYPQPTSRLTDDADMVSDIDERFIAIELYRLECRYGAQMGAVTVATTGPSPSRSFRSRWLPSGVSDGRRTTTG